MLRFDSVSFACRSSCSYISCEVATIPFPYLATVNTLTPPRVNAPVLLALPMPDAHQVRELNQTAALVVRGYKEFYRSGADAVSEAVLRPMSDVMVWPGSMLGYFTLGRTGATARISTSLGAGAYAATKCLFHVLLRSLPSVVTSRSLRFFG
jgi:hypothetical protein